MSVPTLNLRFNIYTIAVSVFGGAEYLLSGTVHDESGNFVRSNVLVNDEVFDQDGKRYKILNITLPVSPANGIQLDVDDFKSDGMPNVGNGLICRPSANFGFPIPTRITNNLTEYLQEFVHNKAIEEIDQKIYQTNTFIETLTLNGTNITNGYVTLGGNPTTAKAITAEVIGGPLQRYPTDFTIVSGNRLTWAGDFASTIASGDTLVVTYFLS